MSRAVYKEQLGLGINNTLMLPMGSYVRHVHEQHGRVTLWYEADLSYPEEARTFHVIGTGRALPKPAEGFYNAYIGTTHLPDKTVWHVYEVAPNGH